MHRFGMVWVLGILAVTVADILGRYCAGRPVTGALELGEAMLAVMGYCGMAATQRAGGNVRVSFLWNRLRGSLGRRSGRVRAALAVGKKPEEESSRPPARWRQAPTRLGRQQTARTACPPCRVRCIP